MAVRPCQIRASAAESALTIPDAFYFQDQYANLKMPVIIIAGEEDRLTDIDERSGPPSCRRCPEPFHRVPGTGHIASDGDEPSYVGDKRSRKRYAVGTVGKCRSYVAVHLCTLAV